MESESAKLEGNAIVSDGTFHHVIAAWRWGGVAVSVVADEIDPFCRCFLGECQHVEVGSGQSGFVQLIADDRWLTLEQVNLPARSSSHGVKVTLAFIKSLISLVATMPPFFFMYCITANRHLAAHAADCESGFILYCNLIDSSYVLINLFFCTKRKDVLFLLFCKWIDAERLNVVLRIRVITSRIWFACILHVVVEYA